jgi:hypothetical protein
MHLKVFVKLKKTLKTLSSGQKNPKKTQKNPKNPKKPTGLGFFKKTRVFSNPAGNWTDFLPKVLPLYENKNNKTCSLWTCRSRLANGGQLEAGNRRGFGRPRFSQLFCSFQQIVTP